MSFFRKRNAIQKVNTLDINEKETILNNLAEPFGYTYEPSQDIFATRQDAPQKHFGYTEIYDRSAAFFHMVFDYETIYFDYNNRTWLIEIWKGQYGINSGCELGVYYADEIVPPEKYASTLFKAVDANENLPITLKLHRKPATESNAFEVLGQIRGRHWWPAIFKMGRFSKPAELLVQVSIRFHDYAMLCSFLRSFKVTLPATCYTVNGLTVYFTFSKSTRKFPLFRRMVRRLTLLSCHLLCKIYNHLTKCFENSGDKLLYLYYRMPILVRLLFRPISHKKRKSGDTL